MFGFGLARALSDVFTSSQSVREEYLQKEYDTTTRRATMYLYSKVVDGLASINGSTGGNGAAHHWVLVAQFEDDSYRTLEGNQNEDGYLHAYYKKHTGDGLAQLRQLGRISTSPSKLREIARNNRLNGTKYDLVSNNCQDWAIIAAKNISKDIGDEVASIPRITPVLSVARNIAIGGPLGILRPF